MGEGVKREEAYAYLMPIYAITLQKPSEYCNYPLAKNKYKKYISGYWLSLFVSNFTYFHWSNDPVNLDPELILLDESCSNCFKQKGFCVL